eukprot:Protomagalhaensia_wolfi_Nauph_80__1780@NODE_2109_length_1210_cov_130_733561_g1649_i0_p1_GENE_NODE_2109_length_1210_cov_130_733561_g1649_i0NODE_2109_length_1210_cov_130_733561_g1649_i0_p1_ORF_typecomplete_len290_score60_01DUF1624/PF07786_12/0_064_NODE_2109_length_1210_cov_130_733561_g1649_i02051074
MTTPDTAAAPKTGGAASPTSYERSATTFVKNVNAERRKNILRIRYHSAQASGSHYILDYLRVVLSLVGGLMLAEVSLREGYAFSLLTEGSTEERPASGRGLYAGGFACMTAAATYETLRYLHYKEWLLFSSGLIEVCSCIALSVCYALPTQTTASTISAITAAAGLVYHHTVFAIKFRTFGGLYAPILPSTHAPTVIPLVALLLAGAGSLVVGCGFRFGGHNYDSAGKGCQVGAFAAWALAAWGEVGVVYVASQNAARRAAKALEEDIGEGAGLLTPRIPEQAPTETDF